MPKKEESSKELQQQYSTFREYFIATVYCTIIALFVTTYVVHPMTVPTPSMEPTILVGDRLLIDKFTYRNSFLSPPGFTPAHDIRRGDIVVFKFPDDPEVLYVKRAVGLPGETLEIRNKTVHINGTPLDEPYKVHKDSRVNHRDSSPHFLTFDSKRDNYGPVAIPKDNYFMMGDNRDDSADSRYFGFLHREYIVGRPLIVFWSYEDDSDAYLRTTLPEMGKLYLERVAFFFTRTRWSRMGHFVR
jgi:signal peptidase I